MKNREGKASKILRRKALKIIILNLRQCCICHEVEVNSIIPGRVLYIYQGQI